MATQTLDVTQPENRAGDSLPVVLHTRVVRGAGGGPEKTILNSPRFLEPFGYRVICAYMHPPRDAGADVLRDRAQATGARFVSVEDRGPWDMRVVMQFLRLCRRERVAIWHGHDYKSNAIGLLLRPLWPMRLVSTAHGFVDQTGRNPLYTKIDRRCLHWYERVICVSADLRDEFLAAGMSADRCILIENAIDTDEYARRQTPQEAKSLLGFPPDRLLIGAVGRLSEEKNFSGLIRAVDRLIASGIDAGLVIVGEGYQREELAALVRSLGCEDRIQLLGYRRDTIDLYQAMDVFALSSIREGLPNVLLEAMALEVPVVATRIAGVPRLVRHEETGLLIEPGDTDQLAAGLRRLLSDPDLRCRLAAAARRTIETSYSFARRMEKIRAVYDEVLSQ